MEKLSLSILLDSFNLVEDGYTAFHSIRVTKYAYAFGCYLGLSQEDLKTLVVSAYLHDIGKAGIDDYILFKNGPLSDEEKVKVKSHVTEGFLMLDDIKELRREADIVLLHHERVDGSGYPYGIKGSQIPYLDRILSIVDVFDAIHSRRPYKKACCVEEVVSCMLKEENFDPFLLKQLIEIQDNMDKVSKLSIEKILERVL